MSENEIYTLLKPGKYFVIKLKYSKYVFSGLCDTVYLRPSPAFNYKYELRAELVISYWAKTASNERINITESALVDTILFVTIGESEQEAEEKALLLEETLINE